MEKKIARWESKGGKYWVDLYYNDSFLLANGSRVVSARYQGRGCGGGVLANSEQEALDQIQNRVNSGYFQADASKNPLQRVSV